MAELGAFLVLAAVVIATPGQDTALTIRNSLHGGRRAGIVTAAGVSAGQAIWTLATAAGLAAVLIASEPAFEAIRLFGAGYLIFLGAQSLWLAWRGTSRAHAEAGPARRLSTRAAFRQGIVSNLGNPKMAIFFSSLLPQFVNPLQPTMLPLMTLGLTFCAMTLVWLSVYAVVVDRAGSVLRRPSVRRAIEGVTGAALTLFGIRLATERA